jgi:hypothetical protein
MPDGPVMRILFVGEGGLGNQIFQYAALSSIAPLGAKLTAIGLEEIGELFELNGPELRVLRGAKLKRFAIRVLVPYILRPLARWLRLFSYVHDPEVGDSHRGSDGRVHWQRGLIPGLVFADGGYYQSSEFWREVFPPRWLSLRKVWRDRAAQLIAAQRVPATRPCFMHVRRGDYLGYTIYGISDLVLPAEFFHRALDELRARKSFDLLLVVTNDPAWARAEFAGVPEAVVISSDPRMDFALMAACEGGIISNSTFSLTAALFMTRPQLVIAPEYWFGFRVREWLPPRIRFEHPHIVYREVLPPLRTC